MDFVTTFQFLNLIYDKVCNKVLFTSIGEREIYVCINMHHLSEPVYFMLVSNIAFDLFIQ